MDLRSSLPLVRSPLIRLNSNQQRQHDRNKIDVQFSPQGGRTTRATTRKIRKLFEDNDENKAASCAISTTSNGSGIDPSTDVNENQIDVAQGSNTEAGPKETAPPKKRKTKPKKRTSIGRWETWEKFAFLRGLRRHGRGHWKKIGESIPTRSTVQVKTHAQVMMRKKEQGINIFEEFDKHTAMEEAMAMAAQKPNGKREGNNYDCDVNLCSSSFPLPRTMKKEHQTSNLCFPEEDRYSNNPRKGARPANHRHLHAFPLSNKTESEFETAPLFEPVTGNHNRHHPFHHQGHHQGHHCYDANHYNFNQHPHSYQYPPSFDTVAASSALFPMTQATFGHQTSAFQVPMIAKANKNSNPSWEIVSTPKTGKRVGTELLEAEADAIEALLYIRAASKNDPHILHI